MKKPLTYGQLPTQDEFDTFFYAPREDDTDGAYVATFEFGNDRRVGTASLTCGQLWRELNAAVDEFNSGDDVAGDWASCVLSVLGFEWV